MCLVVGGRETRKAARLCYAIKFRLRWLLRQFQVAWRINRMRGRWWAVSCELFLVEWLLWLSLFSVSCDLLSNFCLMIFFQFNSFFFYFQSKLLVKIHGSLIFWDCFVHLSPHAAPLFTLSFEVRKSASTSESLLLYCIINHIIASLWLHIVV